MEKLELSRDIEIKTWLVQGTVGIPQERKYILFILQIAENEDGVTSEKINRQLLAEGRRAIAKRLLAQCVQLKLLEEIRSDLYKLTDTGRRTLEEKAVYVPMESQWKIWTTEEPLVPHKILKVEELSNDHQSKEEESEITVALLPPLLNESQNQILNLPFGELQSCTLDLKNKCIPAPTSNGLLVILTDEKHSEIYIKFGNSQERVDILGDTRAMIVDQIMHNSEYSAKWYHEDYSILYTSYENLSDAEKSSFTKSLMLNSPMHSEYGKFKPNKFEVSIYPETKEDLDNWADWWLTQSISTFVLNGEYKKWKQMIIQKFPLFEPDFKSLDEKMEDFINRQSGQRSEKFWYLSAASDWNL